MNKKITNEFDRNKLGEGRNFGIGFSILDKINENEYKALMAFTACKDYLNDFIYIEGTNKTLDPIFGFSHKYTGILKDKEYFYLGINILHYNHSKTQYIKFDLLNELLKTNNQNLIKLLNKLEEIFKIENKTKYEDHIEDILIIKVPIFWSKFSFLTSLYLLFIRCFINITEEELKKDILDLIKDKNEPIIVEDNMIFKSIQKLFNNFDLDLLLKYEYPIDAKASLIHNFGICGRIQQLNIK